VLQIKHRHHFQVSILVIGSIYLRRIFTFVPHIILLSIQKVAIQDFARIAPNCQWQTPSHYNNEQS